MMHLLHTGKTFPVIRKRYFAINYFHSKVQYQNPCPISLPYNVLEGIKILLAYSVMKKSPVTVSQLYEMCNCFRSKTTSLSNLQTILLFFSFRSFLRFSEVCVCVCGCVCVCVCVCVFI